MNPPRLRQVYLIEVFNRSFFIIFIKSSLRWGKNFHIKTPRMTEFMNTSSTNHVIAVEAIMKFEVLTVLELFIHNKFTVMKPKLNLERKLRERRRSLKVVRSL